MAAVLGSRLFGCGFQGTKMRNLFFIATAVLFLSHSSFQNDLDDDVTVEVEEEPEDVAYSSPVPSGKF